LPAAVPAVIVQHKKPSYLLGLILGLLLTAILLALLWYFVLPRFLYQAEVAALDTTGFQSANIGALEDEISRFRTLLDGNVCQAPAVPSGPFARSWGGTSAGPSGRGGIPGPSGGGLNQEPADGGSLGPADGGIPEGSRGPAENSLAPKGGGPAEDRENGPPKAADPSRDQRTSEDMMQTIENATVLVLAVGKENISMGTGFFIGPNLIMTNRHVIDEGLKGGTIGVINKSIGRLAPAELVIYTDPSQLRDYAVLRTSLTSDVPVLKISPAAKRADHVSAWGYPGLNTRADPKMEALLEGDSSSVPELVYSEGVISVIQPQGGLPLISHTAEISQGNSGGPLVDQAGEVIGINTLIRVDDQSKSNRQVNIAFGAGDMIQFLSENNIRID
ncbi:MAG: serine protease, partial [Deltaproteobacteria bacterium]|nr:serine protease [Deltaproteobacteria bacterium]